LGRLPRYTRQNPHGPFFVATRGAFPRPTDAGRGHTVHGELSQPGFIRAAVSGGEDASRIDWAHDSAWRFLPPVRDELGGYLLHDIDLALNYSRLKSAGLLRGH
jgi:hypothetical protein